MADPNKGTRDGLLLVNFLKVGRQDVKKAISILKSINKRVLRTFSFDDEGVFAIIRLEKRSKFNFIEKTFRGKVYVSPHSSWGLF